MNRADLLRATGLYQQATEIDQALGVLDQQGTITAVTITPKDTVDEIPERSGSRTVSTIGLQYPPQMTQAIKAQLEARRDAINKELAELGVGPVVT